MNPSKTAKTFKDMGVGVGLRPAHYSRFLDKTGSPFPRVSWAEVITENYMDWASRPLGRSVQTLSQIRKDLPIALHGVSLSLGSTDSIHSPARRSYLKRLKSLVDRIEPFQISDHLCWTGVEGKNLHDLFPMPFTLEAIDILVERIKQAQDFLGRRILVENVSSYITFKSSQMTEWEFVSEVVKRADCGLLLDINNIYVSSINHRFDPLTYLRGIPWDRVGQIHLAGHTAKDGFLIDTHDEPVCAAVWDLFRWATRAHGGYSTMIERDAQIPEWEVLSAELDGIRSIRHQEISTQEPHAHA